MTSDVDDSESAYEYELVCTDCDFEATVNGSVHEALEVADSHQDEHGERMKDHFVTFELRGDR